MNADSVQDGIPRFTLSERRRGYWLRDIEARCGTLACNRLIEEARSRGPTHFTALCRQGSPLQPNEALHVVDEVGEPNLESRASESNGSGEEAHSVLGRRRARCGARTADLRPLARRIGAG